MPAIAETDTGLPANAPVEVILTDEVKSRSKLLFTSVALILTEGLIAAN